VVFALRFIALAAFTPYTFLWLESNGFDTHQRGLLGGFASAVRFGAPMVLGTLADWSGHRRLVFVTATIINGLAVAALTLQPESATSQGLLLGLCGLTETGSLLDAFVMRSLSWAGAAASAPRARAWGALTWCVAAPLFGTIAERFGIATLFRAYGCFQLLALPVCLMLPIAQAYGETSPAVRTAAGVHTSGADFAATGSRRGVAPSTGARLPPTHASPSPAAQKLAGTADGAGAAALRAQGTAAGMGVGD